MHRYRISYEWGAERKSAEVEANSPAEAVVKFRHVKHAAGWQHRTEVRVTSVCREDDHSYEGE